MRRLIACLLALLASYGVHAQTVVNHVESRAASSTSVSITDSSASTGNTLIVMADGGGSVTGACTDSVAGESWTVDAQSNVTLNGSHRQIVWCSDKNVQTAGSHTITITWTGGSVQSTAYLIEVNGWTSAVGFDQVTSYATSSSTSALSNSVTPNHANSLLAAYVGVYTAGTTMSSWTNSFTALNSGSLSPGGANAYLTQASPAAVTSGATLSASGYWLDGVAVYYGTTGGASCTHAGRTSAGVTTTVPNGTSGSYRLKNGSFGTPDCSTVSYFQPTVGNFGVN